MDAVMKVKGSCELNVTGNVFCWQEKEGIILEDVGWATITGNEIQDNGSYNPVDTTTLEFNLNGRERPFRFSQTPEQVAERGVCSAIILRDSCRNVVISSNAIFNWPVAGPMKYGIEEDATCYYNQFTSNNINFCKVGDILSEGKESMVTNNLSYLQAPTSGNLRMLDPDNRMLQGFDLRLMDYYLEQQLQED
jgi:hypothetical protein